MVRKSEVLTGMKGENETLSCYHRGKIAQSKSLADLKPMYKENKSAGPSNQ